MFKTSQPPLMGSYPTKVALVMLTLCPNIVITTAMTVLMTTVEHSLGTSRLGVEMAEGLSNAGYAFGAVLAAALQQKLATRTVLLGYEALFILASVLTAVSPEIVAFTVGRVLQGLATGLLLVAALPPLENRFPAGKLPLTVAVVNISLFGATTLGPVLGGQLAGPELWRVLFAALTVLGIAGFVVGYLSVEPEPAANPDHHVDKTAVALALLGTALPFFAVSELSSAPFFSWLVLPALIVGLLALAALVVLERTREEPLMPVYLLSHTFSVLGIFIGMVAGAAFTAMLQLTVNFLAMAQHLPDDTTGLLFWPMIAGMAVAAVIFGALFPTKYVPVLAMVGMAVLIASGIALTTLDLHSGQLLVLLSSAGLGFGAGAAVSPALFMAALAAPSDQLGEVFALAELLRAEAAFLVGPILLHVAMANGMAPPALAGGVNLGIWITVALLGGGVIISVVLFVLGGAKLHRPDLEGWVERGEKALSSPAVAAAVRPAQPT